MGKTDERTATNQTVIRLAPPGIESRIITLKVRLLTMLLSKVAFAYLHFGRVFLARLF